MSERRSERVQKAARTLPKIGHVSSFALLSLSPSLINILYNYFFML